jgi:CheY-like chemotaxis protein
MAVRCGEPPPMEPEDRVPRRRVLLVDDNRHVARSLARLAHSLGHEVQIALSGSEALEAAQRFNPEIVLMDIGLPGQTGYDVAREMRSKPWAQNVTLVALTGLGTEGDRRRAIEAGFDLHLTKPVEPDVLEAVLKGGRALTSSRQGTPASR